MVSSTSALDKKAGWVTWAGYQEMVSSSHESQLDGPGNLLNNDVVEGKIKGGNCVGYVRALSYL